MQLTIANHQTVQSLQKKFQKKFPFLKIELFSRQHKAGESTAKKHLFESGKTLAECGMIIREGQISVTPRMTVMELEQTFKRDFGLFVQVFRRSGKAWLETSITDDWTLERQNELGKELSAQYMNTGDNMAAE